MVRCTDFFSKRFDSNSDDGFLDRSVVTISLNFTAIRIMYYGAANPSLEKAGFIACIVVSRAQRDMAI